MVKGNAIVGSRAQGGQFVDLLVWIGNPKDPTKGVTIETPIIDKFLVKENLFSMYPTVEMHLQDRSRFFLSNPICIGDTITIRLAPNGTSKGGGGNGESVPYFNASFSIQTVSCSPDASNGIYTYVITGIYAATKFANEVAQFPKEDTLTDPIYQQVSSSEVIDKMCQEGGLGFNKECDTHDKSFWLCCNETRAQFVQRIIEHAWVGDDDAPIGFTDVNGVFHYTSVKTICSDMSGLTFAETVNNISARAPKKSSTVTFTEARTLNAGGPILNQGGYKLKYSLYNPYNKQYIDWLEIKEFGKDGLLGSFASALGTMQGVKDRTEGWRTKDYKTDETKLANVSNKVGADKSNITMHKDGGTWFQETHFHYNVAPHHNEMVRRAFFQNFINVNIDVNEQGDLYTKPQYRPHIGHVVDVDFSANKKVDQIHSGPYCIAEIVHKYEKGEHYSQNITLVNDGYYGK